MKSGNIKCFVCVILFPLFIRAQENAKPVQPLQFSGAITATNNGISFIPAFILGKPAAIVDLSVGTKKLFFEPHMRFSLQGKPWSFLFWWRYRMIRNNKFAMTLGMHPGLAFKSMNVISNGITKQVMVTQRYLAGELTPTFFLSKNTAIGMYYLYSRGIDRDAIRNTHFITLNSNINNIRMGKDLLLRMNPQFYYLRMTGSEGTYVSATVALRNPKYPISVSTLLNKAIHSTIPGSKPFNWNLNLIYSFNKRYVPQQLH